jgi:hypothetical protein
MSEIAEYDGSGDTFACCRPSSMALVASTMDLRSAVYLVM